MRGAEEEKFASSFERERGERGCGGSLQGILYQAYELSMNGKSVELSTGCCRQQSCRTVDRQFLSFSRQRSTVRQQTVRQIWALLGHSITSLPPPPGGSWTVHVLAILVT